MMIGIHLGTVSFSRIGRLYCWNYYLRKSRYDERKTINEHERDPHGVEVKTEYKFALGMFVSIVSGVLSACFNFGLEAGQSMGAVANEAWKALIPVKENFIPE